MDAPPRAASGTRLDVDNPWPGLDSYDEAAREFFSGRGAEAEELQRRILDEPMTVLFGKSGLGKTSLLKAGVFPGLREKGFLPVLLRLQLRPDTERLIEQVRLALFEALRTHEIDHPPLRDGETLWEYLHRSGLEFWTKQNRLVRPVFVFDQFEELFTLGRLIPAEVAAFREDLADLAENRIPAEVAESDLDAQAMPYKIAIALREDFLADLEGWRLTIPSLRRNRMRLLPMGPEQALQAVWNERTNHLVTEPLARKVVAFLSTGAAATNVGGSSEDVGATVEPALLSLFCQGVNEHRKREGKARFDEALLEGAKESIVMDFYRGSLRDQPDRVRRFIEENLVTEHGFRNSYSVDDAVAHGFVTSAELAALINRHLLRHEHHLGTARVELTHDLLTRAVIEERDGRRRAERDARESQARRRLMRIAGVSGAVAVTCLALAIAAAFAWSNAKAAWKDAEEARDQARSKELAAVAEPMVSRSPERAVLLALEGLQAAHTLEARRALLTAAQYAWPTVRMDKKKLGGTPKVVVLTADGERLAVLATDGDESCAKRGSPTLTLWDVHPGRESRVWCKEAAASSLAFSPDQSVLAVAGNASIVLHATTKTGDVVKRVEPTGAVKSVAFSPDGQWLVWAEANTIRLLDYRNEQAKAVTAAVGPVIVFAVVPDSSRIITVGRGLIAQAIDRTPDGSWLPPIELTLGECTKPQSVSPGAQYVSATWKARSCSLAATSKAGSRFNQRFEKAEGTADILWSAAGNAFAEILLSHDLVIGGSGRFAAQSGSRIKGAIRQIEDDMTRLISVNEAGTRVALIDRGREVKVYFVGDHRPFLSRFEGVHVVVDHDGHWVAAERRLTAGERTAVVDVIPIEFASASGSRARARIEVGGPGTQITRIHAAQNSVIAVLQAPQGSTTVVFDATTGKPRFAPYAGEARVLGAENDLLFFSQSAGPRARVVKVTDGSELAPWEQVPAAGSPPVFSFSLGNAALAVLRVESTNPSAANAIVYSVRGGGLVPSGQVVGLPASLLRTPVRLQLADDGRSLTETRPASRDGAPETVVWPVTSGREPTSPRPAGSVETTAASASPLGHFEVRIDSGASAATRGLTLEKRADPRFRQSIRGADLKYRFSSDDRWLVAWTGSALQVLDLVRGGTAWTWSTTGAQILDLARDTSRDLRQQINDVEFGARNTILKVDFFDSGFTPSTTLIPLDRDLTERFAKWLVPLGLTDRDRCRYLDDEAACRRQLAASGAE